MRHDLSARLHTVDLREFGISALFAAVVLFVAAMVMLNQNVTQLRHSFVWVERAHLIQKRIDDVNNLTNNVEMTVRGFALTGDPRFLARHKKTHGALMAAVHDLDDLTTAESALRPNFPKLQKAVDQHEALYGSLIGFGPSEQAIVAEAITNPAKRHYKEMVTDALLGMERGEQNLVAARHLAVEREARMTYGVALGVAALAFLCGTLGFALTLFGKRRGHGVTEEVKA